MKEQAQSASPDDLLAVVVDRLRRGLRVRRNLPGYGRVHIDRPLPFLYVVRRPADRTDAGTARLVVGEGSYLLASGAEGAQSQVCRMVRGVTGALSEQFGAVLLVEIWTAQAAAAQFSGGALAARPRFCVRAFDNRAGRPAVAALVRGLRNIRIAGRRSLVELRRGAAPVPPGMPALHTKEEAKKTGVVTVGLEVPPVFRHPDTGELFPEVLRTLHRALSRVLQQAGFRFAHHQTTLRPDHYLRLGQRTVLRATLEADDELARVAQAFNLLLAVTPVNTDEAWTAFREAGCRGTPGFHYRLLDWDPELVKRRLYRISLERVEDPAMAELLRDKREEIDRQVTLLHDRNTPKFLYGSLQLYGGDDPALVATAEQLLGMIPVQKNAAERSQHASRARAVNARQFAERAREEITAYQALWPDMTASVALRDDVPGLMVSRNELLVGERLALAEDRVEALLHHEVGTHLVTYCNAVTQPLALLRTGLPGYDELQEGTAVLAEHLVGGLDRERLRLLAARVVAVYRRVCGRAFAEVFEELADAHGFRPATAFTITMRVFRGGGFTKDVVYLRGLVRLLDYLAAGGDLEPLYLGKVSEASLPILRELRLRNVLREPPLRPRYLDMPEAVARMERLRQGACVIDLLNENEGIP